MENLKKALSQIEAVSANLDGTLQGGFVSIFRQPDIGSPMYAGNTECIVTNKGDCRYNINPGTADAVGCNNTGDCVESTNKGCANFKFCSVTPRNVDPNTKSAQNLDNNNS